MKIKTFMMIFTSMLLMFSSNPMNSLIMLILLTILISINSTYILITSWYSYIIFLMMVGGLMIMFIYTVSIIPNEKMKMFMNTKLILAISMMLTLMLSLISNNPLLVSSTNMTKQSIIIHNTPLSAFSISYLFILLLILMILLQKIESPLRSY